MNGWMDNCISILRGIAEKHVLYPGTRWLIDLSQVQVAHLRVELRVLGPLLHEEAEVRGERFLWKIRVFLEHRKAGLDATYPLNPSSLTRASPPGNSP